MTINNPFDVETVDMTKFTTKAQTEALARLELILNNPGLAILSGEIGSGKSTVLRYIATALSEERFHVIYLCASKLKPRELYCEILHNLGEIAPYSTVKAKRLLSEIIEQRNKQNERKLLLIIDEAQDISHDTILELRYLMNSEIDLEIPYAIILCGQPELRKLLRLRKFEPVAQRVKIQFHLKGMRKDEIGQYIKHRTGEDMQCKYVFGESALEKIYNYSTGIPRIINTICRGAIYDAYQKNEDVIEERHVHRAIIDIETQRGLQC